MCKNESKIKQMLENRYKELCYRRYIAAHSGDEELANSARLHEFVKTCLDLGWDVFSDDPFDYQVTYKIGEREYWDRAIKERNKKEIKE